MSTETTKKKIKIDNGTNFARAYTDKAIDAKLPTDLKATSTSLSLLAGATKIGNGINLSGFEYDEATKTLKASGGGASVSPCLNLMNDEDGSVRTSITEEEKNNVEKGLYNSVIYYDPSSVIDELSTIFPQTATNVNGMFGFSKYNLSVDETANKINILSSSSYVLHISMEKNEDGTYPIRIQKEEELEATFGGGGSADTSTMTEKNVVIVEQDAAEDTPLIQKYHGIYGLYRIIDGSITISHYDSNDIIFIGYPFWYKNNVCDGYLMGSIYTGTPAPRSVLPEFNYALIGTGIYQFSEGKIDITPEGCSGNMTLGGLALLAGHKTTSDEIKTAILNGDTSRTRYDVNLMALQYDFKETTDGTAKTKTFLGYVDGDVYRRLTLSGLFDGKQGTAVLEKDSSGTFVSNTPIEYAGAQETHHHTLTIKENGRIVFAANRGLESTTAATNLETLISTFAGTTTAGFGDYILLTVDTAAKLTKQDGTETDLSTLTVTISDTVK